MSTYIYIYIRREILSVWGVFFTRKGLPPRLRPFIDCCYVMYSALLQVPCSEPFVASVEVRCQADLELNENYDQKYAMLPIRYAK